MERRIIAAAYCSRRAHPIASQSSAVNNLHYGTARALTQLAEGDLIRLTRNDQTFKNGEVARVVALDGTRATLEVNDRGTISHHGVELADSQHWDHAYASTIHAAQGASKGLVHFAVDLSDLDESGVTSEFGQ